MHYASLLDLAFENAHCIEHAVADIQNLKRNSYVAGNRLYSRYLYDDRIVNRIAKIILERDQVAISILKRSFASLADYDHRVFRGESAMNASLAGTARFRCHHQLLSQAPSPEDYNAFGYEDIGWSMVPMESMAKRVSIPTPNLTALIDEWSEFMDCDYRSHGRTLQTFSSKRITSDCNFLAEVGMLPFLSLESAIKDVTDRTDSQPGV